MNKINTKSLILAIVFLSFIFLASSSQEEGEVEKAPLFSDEEIFNKTIVAGENELFADINLGAKAAYVFDMAKDEVIYELNSLAQLPLASLTKIMTAIVASETLQEWQVTKIPSEAIRQEGDSGLLVSEKWKVDELSDVMLIASSNDAAYALAMAGADPYYGIDSVKTSEGLRLFIENMNKKTKEIGLEQTHFLNPTGLDENMAVAGGYGSARDIVKLIVYALDNYPDLFSVTGDKVLDIKSRNYTNTNKLVKSVPGIIAGKTGYSDLAGGNLAVVVDAGFQHPVVIVVLGSTIEGRFEDVEILYKESLKWLRFAR